MKTINVIEAVFFAALEKQDASDRAEYLERACGGDPDLRRCVEKLLAAQPNVGQFLQAPAAGLPVDAKGGTVDHAPDERPGTILGPYKLLHEIGDGGMGTVWMAEQTEPVKRRVALKVIKPGMDTKQVLARFEAERQALALMDHPNIARVFDAGATAGGRPYFVMELVKGQPVTEFCDKNRLTTPERLELFVAVCNAIQHAHQKGVIHRDIKPSNVLVALYDGKPVPKVIDFGVAKAVGDPLTDKTLFTRHGEVVGTFEYMSPEQATLDQLDIDTRSDVYALGVLMYELLTGTTPLDKDELRRGGLAEVLRRIREQEPPKPSTRLTSSPGLLATAAAYRKSDSQKLPRAVRGELDWIVMKALDKDRNRRFPTANGLAADVERFLKGEPVQACPPTLSYRFRKYARRHKVALATGTAIAAALLVGTVLSSWQAIRATRAESAIAEEQKKTTAALNTSRQFGQELETRLGEIQTKNDQIRHEQEERRSLYYRGDMREIPELWEAGITGEARRMLAGQPLVLRHFEWHFWDRKMHSEAAAFTLPDVDVLDPARANTPRRVQWRFSDDGSRVVRVTNSPIGFGGPAGLERVPGTLQVWDVATRKLIRPHTLAEDEGSNGFEDIDLSRDGKVVLMTGTIAAKDPAPTGPSGLAPANGWVRVLEVDGGKELFNSRTEMGEGRLSGHLSRDGRKLVTFELRSPVTSVDENPLEFYSGLRCKVWDLAAADRKPVTIEGAYYMSLNPDGSRLFGSALVDGKQTAKLWDTATGQEIPGVGFPLEQFGFGINDAFSPDGSRLAAVTSVPAGKDGARSNQYKRTLRVLDANTGKEVFPPVDLGMLTGPVDPSVPVFSNDGSRVAVSRNVRGGVRNTGEHWEWLIVDAKSGAQFTSFDDPGYQSDMFFARPTTRKFSDDGRQYICAVENTVYTFDGTYGQPVHTLRGNENPIGHMVALPNGRLRTVETGGTIREWDLRPTLPVLTAFVKERVAAGNGRLVRPLQSAICADGAWVARYIPASDQDDPAESVCVWDAAGTATPIELTPPARISPKGVNVGFALRIPQLSADGKLVALFRGEFDGRWINPKQQKNDPATVPPSDVTVWDVASRKMLFHHELQPQAGLGPALNQAWLSPDGATIALLERVEAKATVTSTVRFFDVVAGREGSKIEVADRVVGLSFSPDGRRIAVGILGPQIERAVGLSQVAVFDTGTGERISTIEADTLAGTNGPGPRNGMNSSTWSPDGSRLAFAEPGSSRIHLIDVTTGKRVQTLDASNRGGSVQAGPGGGQLTFSPDGRRIACAVSQRVDRPQTVNVLDTKSGRQVLSLPLPLGVTQRGGTLRFSPDGHRLIHFGLASAFASGPPAPAVSGSRVQVTTWDATPRPEAKQP